MCVHDCAVGNPIVVVDVVVDVNLKFGEEPKGVGAGCLVFCTPQISSSVVGDVAIAGEVAAAAGKEKGQEVDVGADAAAAIVAAIATACLEITVPHGCVEKPKLNQRQPIQEVDVDQVSELH